MLWAVASQAVETRRRYWQALYYFGKYKLACSIEFEYPPNTLAYSISSWEYLCHMCCFSSPAIQREQRGGCIPSSIKSP